MQDSSILLELARVVLPEEFVDNFKMVDINQLEASVVFEMDEFAHSPEERASGSLNSAQRILAYCAQDFPIRNIQSTTM